MAPAFQNRSSPGDRVSEHLTVDLTMQGNTIDNLEGSGRFYRLVDSPNNTHVWLTDETMTNVTWTITPELPDGARLATWDTGPGSFVSLSGVSEVWISAGSTAQVYSIEASYNDVPQWSAGAQFIAVDVRYRKFDHVCRGDCRPPLHDLPTEILPTGCGVPIGLELWRTTGVSGDAIFVTNGYSTLSITQDVVLTIQGVTPSSSRGNLEAKASLGLETATTRVFTVVEAVNLTVTEDPVHLGNSMTDGAWSNETPVFLICEETNQTARMRIDFSFMPPDNPSTNVTAYWETNTFWVLGHDIGGVLSPSTNWSLAHGDGRTAQVDTVWEYAASREYSLWVWMDCNTNSGSFDPEETHRKVDIKVVNTTVLTLDDVDSSRTATDITWMDDGPNATNTLLLSEDTNGTARMDVSLGWVPAVGGDHFRVEITAEEFGEFGFSTNGFIPTNQPYRVEWTNAVESVEACRMYSVRGWFDCNGNGAYDDGEPHRKAYVAVPKVEIAMDANRDLVIDFTGTNDIGKTNLFWLNDDYDTIHYEELDWHEDDSSADLDGAEERNCDDNRIGGSGYCGGKPPAAADNYCLRDLEDFTVVQVKVPGVISNLTGITYWLGFDNYTGNPSVNLFKAITNGVTTPFTYLTNGLVATNQAKEIKAYTVGTDWQSISTNNINRHDQPIGFLLEGKTAGKGNFTFVVMKDGQELCRSSVSLELRPITNFYDVYQVGQLSQMTQTKWNVVAETNYHQIQTNVAYAAESDKYLLYVHGWNVSPAEKRYDVETVFKRLWWQKFKGGIGLYDWPALYGCSFFNFFTGPIKTVHHFDDSEMISWLSATALARLMNDLNTTGQLCVLAHSQGNPAMGEALQKYTGANNIKTYIASQAAMSGQMYSQTAPSTTFPWPSSPQTPQIYGWWHSGDPSSTPDYS